MRGSVASVACRRTLWKSSYHGGLLPSEVGSWKQNESHDVRTAAGQEVESSSVHSCRLNQFIQRMRRFVLAPHRKKVVGSIAGLSAWSLHVLSRFSPGSPGSPGSKNTAVHLFIIIVGDDEEVGKLVSVQRCVLFKGCWDLKMIHHIKRRRRRRRSRCFAVSLRGFLLPKTLNCCHWTALDSAT